MKLLKAACLYIVLFHLHGITFGKSHDIVFSEHVAGSGYSQKFIGADDKYFYVEHISGKHRYFEKYNLSNLEKVLSIRPDTIFDEKKHTIERIGFLDGVPIAFTS